VPSAGLVIRPFRPEDAPARVALAREIQPWIVVTPRGLLHRLETEPPRARARHWSAESEGRLVGAATARFAWWTERADLAELSIAVRRDARGRGIGGRLYALAEEYLVTGGAGRVEAWVVDDAGERFAAARGYEPTRSAQLWSVDPRTIDVGDLPRLARDRAAEDLRVVPLRAVRERERDLHALYAEAAGDEPADEPETNVPFDDWRRMLDDPDLSLDGSFVVLHRDRPVSFAWLGVDAERGRGTHWMTGTLRQYRRRGLARLAKMATIRWAAENGITALYTGNDSTNADMLALNEHLGYRRTTTGTTYAKET
jgi:GNAT superfamily N-acetyltransferase